MMNIRELFSALDLTKEMVRGISEGIEAYNIRNPSEQLRELRPEDHINVIMMSHMPFIGKALAKRQDRQFFDEERTQPLDNAVYAAIFASLALEKFYTS